VSRVVIYYNLSDGGRSVVRAQLGGRPVRREQAAQGEVTDDDEALFAFDRAGAGHAYLGTPEFDWQPTFTELLGRLRARRIGA
jgi:hypothetical protein